MRIHRSVIAAVVIPMLLRSSGESTRPTHPEVKRVGQITGFAGRPFAVHVTRGGDLLVTEQDINRLIHVDAAFTTSTPLEVGEDPGDVVANRAGTIAYVSGFQDGTIGIVDIAGDSTIVLVELPGRNAYRLALSPFESRLYVTSTSGTLFVLSTSTRLVSKSKQLGGSLQGMALDHRGRNLYLSSTGGDIWRVDPSSLEVVQSTHIDCAAQDVALSIDDAEMYVACESGSIAVLDPVTLATIDVIPVAAGSAFGLAVTPDNAQLWVSSPASGRLTIFDTATRQCVRTVRVGGLPRRIAFTAHGDKAYIANEWNWVSLVE